MSNKKRMGGGSGAMRRALVDTIPVMIGYLFLGLGFGVMLYGAGYGLPWAIGMSVLIYSGSMQYLAVELLSSGASLITTALTTLMVNARHLFYGISVIELYRPLKKSKPYMLFALTDENYSIICGRPAPVDVDRHAYYFYVTLFNHLYWIVGSALGSLAGSLIPFNTKGIDFALTALFVTIFVDQWCSTKNHTPVLTGALSSLLCLIVFGADAFLVPSMVVITLALTIQHRGEMGAPREEGDDRADTNA